MEALFFGHPCQADEAQREPGLDTIPNAICTTRQGCPTARLFDRCP